MKTKRIINVMVDFYCDTFRNGIVPVPKDIAEQPESIRRTYIMDYLNEVSKRQRWIPRNRWNPITIIRAKLIRRMK